MKKTVRIAERQILRAAGKLSADSVKADRQIEEVAKARYEA